MKQSNDNPSEELSYSPELATPTHEEEEGEELHDPDHPTDCVCLDTTCDSGEQLSTVRGHTSDLVAPLVKVPFSSFLYTLDEVTPFTEADYLQAKARLSTHLAEYQRQQSITFSSTFKPASGIYQWYQEFLKQEVEENKKNNDEKENGL